jgi:hypothetical protein
LFILLLNFLLISSRNLVEASKYLSEAAQIKEQCLGKSLSLAKTLANLASIQIELGQLKDAEELLTQCLDIQTVCSGYECGDNSRTLLHRAHLTHSVSDMRESLRIALVVWPPSHSHTIKVRCELIKLYLSGGGVDRLEALEHLRVAREALQEGGARVQSDLKMLQQLQDQIASKKE